VYLELTDVKGFAKFINAVSSITSMDVYITTSKTHLTINQTNPQKTAMVILNIEKGYFDAYRVEDETVFAVTMMDFQKTLKKFDKFKRLKIELSVDEAKLKFYSQDGKRRKQSSLTLVDVPDTYEPMNPKMDYPIRLQMDSRELRQSIQDCYDVTDDDPLEFHMNENEFEVSVKGIMGSNNDTWKVGEDLTVLLSDNAEVLLPMDDTQGCINKSYTIADKVAIGMKDGMPMSFTYTFKNGTMKFVIAPRIR